MTLKRRSILSALFFTCSCAPKTLLNTNNNNSNNKQTNKQKRKKKGPPTVSSALNGASDINQDAFSNKYRLSVLVAIA